MKTAKTILFITIVSLVLTQCKKDPTEEFINEVVGTYVVYDTLRDVAGGCSEPMVTKTYPCVVTKTSETTIKFSQLFNESADMEASISGSNITVTAGTVWYGDYNPVITRSGTSLSGSYTFSPTACDKNGSVTAIKQ